jgi:hypothetical protein
MSKFDRLMSIAVETERIPNRGNFPLKSKAKNFDGLTVGFRPSERYFALKIQRVDGWSEAIPINCILRRRWVSQAQRILRTLQPAGLGLAPDAKSACDGAAH